MNVNPVFKEQHRIHIHDRCGLAWGWAGAGKGWRHGGWRGEGQAPRWLARGWAGAEYGMAQVRTDSGVGGHQLWRCDERHEVRRGRRR